MTEKTSKTAEPKKSGKKSGGRPKGSVNKSGPLISRIADKADRNILGFMDRTGRRLERWSSGETDDKRKDVLLRVREALSSSYRTFRDGVFDPLNQLKHEGYVPPKVQTAAIDYAQNRHVWIKASMKPKYLEMGYEEQDLNNLFVFKVVKGMVVVTVGEGGKLRFNVPKLHVAVREPEQDEKSAA